MRANRQRASFHRNPLSARYIASLCLLWALPVLAEETSLGAEYYLQDFPVVLTASRLNQPQSDAPSAMTVIDSEMIMASGFRSVPELMRLVPGMYVGFADANRPLVSLHGASDEYARRMQILIDGRSVYLPPFGGVSWANLPLQIEDIERIEVVRGPSSASHGSNSFYGVINIITRDAFSQNGASVTGTVGGASDISARFGRVGEQLDFRISVGSRADQGLNNAVLNDHNETHLFNFRGNYHPNLTDSIDLQLGSSHGVYGLGIAGRPEDAFRETTGKSDFIQASWLHIWPASDESKLTYSQSSNSSLDPYLCIDSHICQFGPVFAQGFTHQAVSSQRNELEWQNIHQLNENNRLLWGVSARSDYADYPLFFSHPYTVSPWQLFGHDEWRITRSTVLNIGTMFEDDGMGNKSNSPRASLNYHVTPQHTLRIGLSTATRSPVMSEAFISANNTIWGGAYVPPLAPLVPEKVFSREIGYLGEFHALGITVDARVYQDRVSDIIWWDKYVTNGVDTDPDAYKNLLAAEYAGLDATVKCYWDAGSSFMALSYAYQEASASLQSLPTQFAFPVVSDFYQREYLNQFPQTVPTNSASLLLSKHIGASWQLSAGYYLRDPVRVGDVSPDVTPEYSMKRLDLRAAKKFMLSNGGSADVALVVQNATQQNYTKYGTVNATAEIYFKQIAWLTTTINF